MDQASSAGLSERERTIIDLRLAAVARQLSDPVFAQNVLDRILSRSLDKDLLLPAVALQARVYQESGKDYEGWQVFAALEQHIPQSEWPANERIFYYRIKDSLNTHYKNLLLTAERLFENGLHAESVPLFAEIMQASLSGAFEKGITKERAELPLICKVRYRLVQALYLSGEHEKVVNLLKTLLPLSPEQRTLPVFQEIERNQLYLAALSFRQLKHYEEAIQCLKRYQSSGDALQLEHLDTAYYELALNSIKIGRREEAENVLKNLLTTTSRSELRMRCHLCLARIDIDRQNYKEAEERLLLLDARLGEKTDLRFEMEYLQGELAFNQGKYQKAADSYEKALPQRNRQLAEWTSECLYHLGWSYLRIGDDSVASRASQINAFERSQAAFEELNGMQQLSQQERERGILAIAQCQLRKGYRFGDESAYKEAAILLADSDQFISVDARAQALVLQAEVTPDHEKKDALYGALLSEEYRSSPFWLRGWFLRAHNCVDFSQKLEKSGNFAESKKVCARAIPLLEEAYQKLKNEDPRRAALALKYEAECCLKLENDDSLQQSFALLERLVNQEIALLNALSDPAEIYHLRGRVAMLLANKKKEERLRKIAEQSMVQVIANYANSPLAPDALHHLFTLYFSAGNYLQAKHISLKLAADYPSSPLAGSALFWAAECSEWLQDPLAEVRALRQRVYEEYPESPHAAEAFFNLYSYSDYLKGKEDAILHLQAMQTRFPHSPFLINAQYLLGMECKRNRIETESVLAHPPSLTTAIDAFNQAKNALDFCLERNLIPEERRDYFTQVGYRALLEEGLTNMLIAEQASGAKQHIYLEYSEKCFRTLLQDLNTLQLSKEDSFLPLCEEAQFGLAQVHTKRNEKDLAETVLNHILENYRTKKVAQGYLLSRVWFELGLLAMDRSDYTLANDMLVRAESTAQGGLLSSEQKLELWLKQAQCQRALGKLDRAMSILSQVINDDSISSLRLQAMYLRSEIYEEQGRSELAIKQLEATARKGGEWAQRARVKLEEEYGYR